MSYTAEVREMISETEVNKTCCIRTELLLMRTLFAKSPMSDDASLIVSSEAMRHRITHVHRKMTGLRPQISLAVSKPDTEKRNVKVRLSGFPMATAEEIEKSNECCLKSFLKIMFLSCGRISSPSSSSTYIEFTPNDFSYANLLYNTLEWFNIKCGISGRRGSSIVYIKNLEGICDYLTLVGANKATLDFQVMKAEREVNNLANRTVNCDMSNLSRSNESAEREASAVKKLMDNGRFYMLPANVQEIGRLRLSNRSSTLSELGEMVIPPISKSGVAHRMKKILEEAELV